MVKNPENLLRSLTKEKVNLENVPIDRQDKGYRAVVKKDIFESTHSGDGDHDPHIIPKTRFTKALKTERGWSSPSAKGDVSHDKNGNFEVMIAAAVAGSLDTGTDRYDLELSDGTPAEVKEGFAQINNGARVEVLTRSSSHLRDLHSRYSAYVRGWQELRDLMRTESPTPRKLRAFADMIEHGPHFDLGNLNPTTVEAMSALESVLQSPEVADIVGMWTRQSKNVENAQLLLEEARKQNVRSSMRTWLEQAKSRIFAKIGGNVLFNVYEGDDHYRVYTIKSLSDFNDSYVVRGMNRGQITVELAQETSDRGTGMSAFDRMLYATTRKRYLGEEFWVDARSVSAPPTVNSLPVHKPKNAGGVGYEIMDVESRMVRVRIRCDAHLFGNIGAEPAETMSPSEFREAFVVLRAPHRQWSSPSRDTVSGYMDTLNNVLSQLESEGRASVPEDAEVPFRGIQEDLNALADVKNLDVEAEAVGSSAEYDFHDARRLDDLYSDAEVARHVFRRSSGSTRSGLPVPEYVELASRVKQDIESRGSWRSRAGTRDELVEMYGLEKNATNDSGLFIDDLEQITGCSVKVTGGRGENYVFSATG